MVPHMQLAPINLPPRSSRLMELLWTGVPPRRASSPPAPLPATEPDWQRVLNLAVRHGLGPLLAAELLERGDVELPNAIVAQSKSIRERAARRALSQIAELLRVLAAFQREGIPALTFKGQLLAAQAYGDVSLRSCFDLDIFVPESEVLRAKQALMALGYRPEFVLLPHQEADLLRIECEYTFIHATTAARVDLQWRPRARYFSFPLPARELWERSISTTLAGHPVKTFAIEDLVLMLVVHGAKHTWNRLDQVSTLAAVLRTNPGMDWSAVEQRAREHGAYRMLLLGVHLATSWFSAPVPDRLGSAAEEDGQVIALARELAQAWFVADTLPSSVTSTLRLHLRMRERFVDRVRHCFWLAVTPGIQDWQINNLRPVLHRLHYCLRPLRLVRMQFMQRWSSHQKPPN